MAHATDPAHPRTPATPAHPPVLDVLDGTIAARRAGGHDVRPLQAVRHAVDQLLDADLRYDASLAHLRAVNLQIAEDGWLELAHNALRTAGDEFVRAQLGRDRALHNATGGAA